MVVHIMTMMALRSSCCSLVHKNCLGSGAWRDSATGTLSPHPLAGGCPIHQLFLQCTGFSHA